MPQGWSDVGRAACLVGGLGIATLALGGCGVAPLVAGEDEVMVVVARRDLHVGVTITEDDIEGVSMPLSLVPDGVFLSYDDVLGRLPKEHVLADELVRVERLADPMAGVGVHAILPRGMRAMSVNVVGAWAQGWLIDPGNFVDLVVTVPSDPANPQSAPITRIEEQAVFVLGVRGLTPQRGEATDGALQAPPRAPLMGPQAELVEQIRTLEARLAALEQGGVPAGPPAPDEREPALNITLLVTKEQAERIVAAQDAGEMTLALRNDLDATFAVTRGATTEKILAAAHEKPQVIRKRSQVLRVIPLEEEVLESVP